MARAPISIFAYKTMREMKRVAIEMSAYRWRRIWPRAVYAGGKVVGDYVIA